MAAQLPLITVFMFLIATRYRAMNNIIHECTHYSFSSSRKFNLILGKVAAAVIFTSYTEYRTEHMSHHRSLGDYENDLDFQSREKFKFEENLTPKTLIRHILTPILGLHFPQYLYFSLNFKDGVKYGLIKALLLVVSIYLLFVSPLATILLIFIPFVWIFSAINYWTDCVDHAGLLQKDDELFKSRNFTMNKILRSVLFPRNDCYHLVHHLFPSIPAQHMEKAHEKLLENHSYAAACETNKARVGKLAPAE